GGLDLVLAREERLVPAHRIEQEPLVRLRRGTREGRPVPEVHADRPRAIALAGNFRGKAQRDPLFGLHTDDERVGGGRPLAEERVRQLVELDGNLRDPLRQPLSTPDVEGNAVPAPAVDAELDGRKGGRARSL